MKNNPLKIIGGIFTAVAAVELVVLLVLLAALPFGSMEMLIPCGILLLQIFIFGTIGLVFLSRVRKQQLLKEELLTQGFYETASVVDTERVMNVRVNGRHPYRVICRIKRDGVLHEYRSHQLYDDPGLLPGDPVNVYLDRRDDSRYYVDVESASPAIIRHP